MSSLWNIVSSAWRVAFFNPILNVLVILAYYSNNLGVAILGVVALVQVLLTPLTVKRYKLSQKIADLYPQLRKLSRKYRKKPKVLKQKQKELYKKHGIKQSTNVWLIVATIPVVLAVYQAVQVLASGQIPLQSLYSPVVKLAENLNVSTTVMGMDLLGSPSLGLLLVMGVASFVSSFVTFKFFDYMPKEEVMQDLKEQLKSTGAPGMTDQDIENFAKLMYYMRYLNLLVGPVILVMVMKAFPAVIAFYLAIFNLMQAVINGMLYILTKGGVTVNKG